MGRRTVKEWEALVRDYEASGLGQALWCNEKGINLFTFRGRLSRMRKSTSTERSAVAYIVEENPSEITETTETTETSSVKEADQATNQPSQTKANGWVSVSAVAVAKKTRASGLRIGIGQFRVLPDKDFDEGSMEKICRVLMKLC